MPSEPVSWLYALQDVGVKLGLDGIRGLLGLLDRPDRAFRSILVGGTNGKGSVAAMLDAVFAAHGVASGLYTSPHLVRPNERVRVRGEDASDEALDALLLRVGAACARGVETRALATHPSFFEVMTAAALEAFRDAEVAAAVLEVGLGGRLDATNAVDPEVSVVVSVGLDHVGILGNTLEAIAREKGAIARAGRPLVTGVAGGPALDALRAAAESVNATLIEVHAVSRLVEEGAETFRVETERARYPALTLPLVGAHQKENARVAIVAFERFADALGISADADAVRGGLAATRWGGRLQWIDGTPPLLLDGAHNEAGVATLLAHLDAHDLPRPILLFSAMRDKDLETLLRPLATRASAVVVTAPPVRRAADPHEIAGRARAWCEAVEAIPDPSGALDRARNLAGPDGFVLVAGSLYLVGSVLSTLEGTPAPGPVSM